MERVKRKARPRGVNEKNLEIIKRYQDGDKDALDELIQFNYDFIYNMATNKKDLYYPLEVDDIFQDMIIGLMAAADRFDFSQDKCPFLSYATFWMHQMAARDANENYLINFPANVYSDIKKLNKHKKSVGYLYSDEDIDSMLEYDRNYNYNREKLEFLYNVIYQMYDILNSEDCFPKDTGYFEDRIENIGITCNYDDYIFNKEVKSIFKNVFSTLTERERIILTKRFGLDGEPPMTLEEVGKIFHVTRDRIRQIEAKAIRKLRNPTRSKYFK